MCPDKPVGVENVDKPIGKPSDSNHAPRELMQSRSGLKAVGGKLEDVKHLSLIHI
jgi:hypothetical protein